MSRELTLKEIQASPVFGATSSHLIFNTATDSGSMALPQEFWQIIVEDGYEPDLTPEQAAERDRRLAEFEKDRNYFLKSKR